ncbi:hypothetical protein BPNPMPFG_003350 [Mesorhizobium sp. AR07]|uniref:hypothetical protein n=1 Tax=Mesorhizobium sp. AR07 TaxID=2865838 RepID=UPI002160CA35|nr:hypothetical protein [Mesorhizobium sp. AR07]UVK47563.1 hypothetical protein BPNPMPFG_003350 [Mesorhizobium sp. AR07]
MTTLLERRRFELGTQFGSTFVEKKRAVEEVTRQSVRLASRAYQKVLKSDLKKPAKPAKASKKK